MAATEAVSVKMMPMEELGVKLSVSVLAAQVIKNVYSPMCWDYPALGKRVSDAGVF